MKTRGYYTKGTNSQKIIYPRITEILKNNFTNLFTYNQRLNNTIINANVRLITALSRGKKINYKNVTFEQ